jgi:hypothetical protein
MSTVTNLECALNVLAMHREARGWSDEAVATDLLTQLSLDPAGTAKNATTPAPDPAVVTEADVAVAETAAGVATDKAEAARASLHAQTAATAQTHADEAAAQAKTAHDAAAPATHPAAAPASHAAGSPAPHAASTPAAAPKVPASQSAHVGAAPAAAPKSPAGPARHG